MVYNYRFTDKESSARQRPSFFIIGAPKCGTTSMAKWLAEHPAIYISPIKEPHYYSTDLANRTVSSIRRYQSLFKGAGEAHRAIGEASTWYLYSREAVGAIEKEYPGARYIVMTRDPVEMAQSLYHHNVRVLHEDQASFESAWRLQATRAAGSFIPAACTEPAFLQYQAACSLGSQLERLYDQVPSERVLHIPLASLSRDPAGSYKRVLAFLNISDDGRQEFLPVNQARGHRSLLLQKLLRLGGRLRFMLGISRGLGLARFNERSRLKECLTEAFKSELDQAFANERRRLAAIIDKFK